MKKAILFSLIGALALWLGAQQLDGQQKKDGKQKPAPATTKSAAADADAGADAKSSPAPSRADDEAAIRAAGAEFIQAYNARDAKKLAALWSPEAVYVDPATGEEMVGRDAIEKEFEEAFSDKQDAKLAVDLDSIDFVSPNVAVIRGTAHVIKPGAEPSDSEFTSVRIKQNGQWLIDRVSEVEKEKPAPSAYEHLKELEWMIGSWHDDDPRPSVEIQTDVSWTKNRNFITRAFAVTIGERVNKSGMQIIGWDPAAKQIRSWVFDSDGGFGEGTWSRKGNRWTVQNTITLADGGKATSTNTMTKLDDNSFKWESVNREIDGELQPNVDPILVVRKSDQ